MCLDQEAQNICQAHSVEFLVDYIIAAEHTDVRLEYQVMIFCIMVALWQLFKN